MLDTHVVLHWFQSEGPRLTSRVAAAITDPAAEVHVSAATVWEIEIKRATGKLQVPDDLIGAVATSDFLELEIRGAHGVAAGRLPLHHHDPFDRMLVAQAQIEGLVLVSADDQLRAYDVPIMSALV